MQTATSLNHVAVLAVTVGQGSAETVYAYIIIANGCVQVTVTRHSC